MTRDQIIAMSFDEPKAFSSMLRDSGLWPYIGDSDVSHLACAMKFAAIVAAAEREECAKVCDQYDVEYRLVQNTSQAIACAAAIRARKEKT